MIINIFSILISHLCGVVTGCPRGQFGRGQAVPGGGAVPGSSVRQPGPALGPRGASSSSHPVSRGPALPANADLSCNKRGIIYQNQISSNLNSLLNWFSFLRFILSFNTNLSISRLHVLRMLFECSDCSLLSALGR